MQVPLRRGILCNRFDVSWLSPSLALKFSVLAVVFLALVGEFWTARTEASPFSIKQKGITTFDSSAIPPGGLPAYTGWARPEKTLARYFSILSVSESFFAEKRTPIHEFIVTVQCRGHRDCKPSRNTFKGSSSFFLRAYGPAVLPGTVTSSSCNEMSCFYEFRFRFVDPGLYTIEAVLTFSNPPPIQTFPLDENQQEPAYEGYLLPEFPLLKSVVIYNGDGQQTAPASYCTREDILEESSQSAREKARWKVTGKVNDPSYSSKTENSLLVSKIGYKNNVNSLGIHMEYQYNNACQILPASLALAADRCAASKPIHIIYIGDSVIRVQNDILKDLLKESSDIANTVEFSFYSLHGGYRKNKILGPTSVANIVQEAAQEESNKHVAILFNTGLHDIHRLCGSEWRQERHTYVSSNFKSCLEEYKGVLHDFQTAISSLPESVLVAFQSTTAAWPKYGNYGIAWETNAQKLPLDSSFAEAFNEIAYETLTSVPILDGYWITYPRPDNREVGDIGKKLSHPGDEVLVTMSRIWAMLIYDSFCK